MVSPNMRESLANKYSIEELEVVLNNYKPRSKVGGSNNGMFKTGEGEKYTRLRIKGEKVRLSHIVWRVNTKQLIPVGYNIHHKDENKRNNDISNLELEHAVKHGKFNLKKSGVLKGGDDTNADI